MANLYAERVRANTSTLGTGTLSLGAAPIGFRSFGQALLDGQLVSLGTVYYAIDDGLNWEVGSGIYTDLATDTLTRTVAESSAGGSAIFLSGAAVVALSLTAAFATQSTLAAPSANPVFTGVVTLTGPLALTNSTTPTINFLNPGIAAPSYTTRSVGTKLVLYNSLSSSSTDYALGITGGTLWASVPANTQQFVWYAGVTQVAVLSGAGVWTFNGGIDNTVIGGVSPAAGTFTSLIASTPSLGTSSTQIATTAFVAPMVYNIGRNRLHNARFRIQSRGTSFVNPASVYTADRWLGANGPATISFAALSGYGPSQSVCVMTLPVTGSSTATQIMQRMSASDCHDLSGQTVTVSWYGSVVASGTTINQNSVTISIQTTSAKDNWSATLTNAISQSVASFPFAARMQFSFVMPSVTNGMNIIFGLTCAGGTGTVVYTLSSLQLELGGSATAFEDKPLAEEMVECRRYYRIVGVSARGWLTTANVSNDSNISFPRMRIAPSATLLTTAQYTSPNLATAGLYVQGTSDARYEIISTAAGDTYSLFAQYGLSADL